MFFDDLAGREVDEVAALDLERAVEVDLRALDRGRHDVVRRRVVRALELLAQVRREGRQVGRERRGRRRAAGILYFLSASHGCRPAPRARLSAIQRLAAGISSSGVATISSTRPELLGLRRPQPLALQQDTHQRLGDPDHPHRAGDAAGARQQPERAPPGSRRPPSGHRRSTRWWRPARSRGRRRAPRR